jgi:hypothetical protein
VVTQQRQILLTSGIKLQLGVQQLEVQGQKLIRKVPTMTIQQLLKEKKALTLQDLNFLVMMEHQ